MPANRRPDPIDDRAEQNRGVIDTLLYSLSFSHLLLTSSYRVFELTLKQAIIEALEKVCYVLPSKYRKECDDFVKQYADEMIKLLLQDLPPKEVCAALGLCSKTFKTLLFEAAALLGGSTGWLCLSMITCVQIAIDTTIQFSFEKFIIQTITILIVILV